MLYLSFFLGNFYLAILSEPWDSNAWDNLLDLARFGDEKSSINAAIKGDFLITFAVSLQFCNSF